MKLKPIDKCARYFAGSSPLPAGAIPMAAHDPLGGLVCLTPSGRWITWQAGSITSMPPETQKAVVAVISSFFGGAEKTAEKFGASVRTVEGWSQGRPIKISTAYDIAATMSKTT